MKRIVLFVFVAAAASATAFAQTSPDIEKALLAAPANMREAATVILLIVAMVMFIDVISSRVRRAAI